ncbi:MAG: bifunctional metallophosphatase/5'-nucleotidase [Bacteroidota bacterium]
MIYFFRRIFLAFIIVLAIFDISKARDIEIKIIVTSDIHATVFPYDFVNNMPLGYGLANIHYLLESVRMQNANKIVLLENGDFIQGQPTAYYSNFIDKSKNNFFASIMNFMKYDAAVIGNHDIEAGPEIYNSINKQMDAPWLGANVISKETNEPYFVPYRMINKSGVNIAVLGLTTSEVQYWLPENLWKDLRFEDMVESAKFWIDKINENENPDVIIGLFHSGFGEFNPDVDSEIPSDNTSAYIARFVPGFDVIFSGHDHTERDSVVVNINGDSVLVLGAGSYGKSVAVAHLDFDRESRNVYKLLSKRGEIFPITGLPPSSQFMEKFNEEISNVYEYANKSIGSAASSINTKNALFGNSKYVDFIHQLQIQNTDADISFAAPLSFNTTIEAGEVRMRDLYKWYPYDNYLFMIELSGQEVKDYLEYSYGLWFNQVNSENDYLLKYKLDAEGRIPEDVSGARLLANSYYNFDSAAGIKYIVDVSKPFGDRINILSLENGDTFHLDKMYKVALNSYRASGGGGHLIKGLGLDSEQIRERLLFSGEKTIREQIRDYIENLKTINPKAGNNWSLIPAETVNAAISKEKDILFK